MGQFTPITMRILCLLIFLLCRLNPSRAQEEEKIRDLIENQAENVTDEDDLSELTERLAFFRKHPINLNQTTAEVLKSLIFLSPLQIGNFFNYLANGNRLLDVLELQAIPGFDTITISKLLPFVTISAPKIYEHIKLRQLHTAAEHDLMLRYSTLLQQQKGFKDLPGSRYLGTPEKILLRYRYIFPGFASAALIMEKDAGEPFFNKKTGMDHLSAHLALYNLGRIRKLVVGDYSLQFGQGLTLWSGFAFGKGPDITSVATKDAGLKPYTSSNEASFFRGVASTIDLGKNINFSPFISYRELDASLKAMPDSSYTLSNIGISGLHRTATELKNQKRLSQLVYGAALQYITDNLNIGLVSYQSAYQHLFVTGSQLYNKYSFTGKSLSNAGLHYNYTYNSIYFYGELGKSLKSGWAILNAAMATLSPKTSAVLLYRNYDKDYHNFFSRAVGEATETNNEQGLYMGLNYMPVKNLICSVYGDYFKFPWLKYRVDAASSGYELLAQLVYTKGKILKATLRFKREQKQQNPDADNSYKQLVNVLKQSYRLEWNWKINQKINFHQRTEITQYQKDINKIETGYLIYKDVDYSPMSSPISANLRLAYFNTPSYNSRIYAYEDDVLYGAGSGVYSGKGIRSYLNIKYHLMKKMDIWGRYALSLYRQTTTIGSGLDEIEGNCKTEVKFQVRYQF